MYRPRIRLTGAAAAVLALTCLLAGARLLSAHDFWLVPDAFEIASGGLIEVRGQTSSAFPTSESAVAVDRIAEARILTAAGETPLGEFSHAGTSLLVRHRPNAAGQHLIAVSLRARTVKESAQSFRRYLVLEGAPEALQRYEREGRLPTDSTTRRYAKYAKTLVEVGRGGARAFDRTAGHPVEFVPLSDPATLRAGDTLAVRLLYRGRPLAGAHVHAGAAAPGVVTTRPTAGGVAPAASDGNLSLTTDVAGLARVPVARAGTWNVRTIQIVPADAGPGADWDVHWATLVFRVLPRTGADAGAGAGASAAASSPLAREMQREGDSAAVAMTVDRYHAALGSGDSTAALALLAPRAVILESGGVETREEYRAHHLPGDIAFARAVKSVRGPVRVVVRGDVAWASSTSTTQGEFRGRAINSAGAELMVLTREPSGWKISAIHWSSRNRRP